MPKDFLHYYIEEADRIYSYRLKFACDDLDNAQMDRLESALGRYELHNCSAVRSTPIQEHPLDFPNISNTRVHIVDIELRYPASHDMLRNLAAESTGVNIGAVAVYGEHDPREDYTQDLLDPQTQRVLDEDYPEQEPVEEYYGKTLTDRLLDSLRKQREQRDVSVVTNELIPDQVHDDAGAAEHDPGEAGGVSPLGGTQR